MTEFLIQLRRKHDLLQQVLELTRQQENLIAEDETDKLLTNIGKRQKLIDELDQIQAELPDKEALRKNSDCLKLVTEVNGILKSIQVQDDKNEKTALERMEYLRTQMLKVNQGRKTLNSYEPSASNNFGGAYINKTK